LIKSLRFVVRHRLNRSRLVAALARWLRWQIGSRLLPGPVLVPFVNGVGLLARPGMVGATGNVCCGLPELDDLRQRQPEITLAREQLSWAPQVALREGLWPRIA
jgi:hypothetical protein